MAIALVLAGVAAGTRSRRALKAAGWFAGACFVFWYAFFFVALFIGMFPFFT